MEKVKRKPTRLKSYDYSSTGAYFITICTKERKPILSQIVCDDALDDILQTPSSNKTNEQNTSVRIVQTQSFNDFSLRSLVGTGVPDGPQSTNDFVNPHVLLTDYGKIADKYIRQMNDHYKNLSVDNYIIMPNHIHMLITVSTPLSDNGPSGTPVPTVQNSTISRFISTFKRFCNKEYGVNIWQYRSYDHVIRDREDYEARVKYISDNPKNWFYDHLYSDN